MTDEHKGPDTSALRESMAALACERFKLTGDPRFAHAAGVLRGKRGGRPPTDDTEGLTLAKNLLTLGAARSPHDACVQAVTILFSPDDIKIDAKIKRLSRKLKKSSDINSYG